MSEPLSPAERAVAEALAAGSGSGITPEACAWEARVAVAAARKPMYEEVAQRLLQHAQDAEDNDATEDAVYTFMVAADIVREWAALEGEQDHA